MYTIYMYTYYTYNYNVHNNNSGYNIIKAFIIHYHLACTILYFITLLWYYAIAVYVYIILYTNYSAIVWYNYNDACMHASK